MTISYLSLFFRTPLFIALCSRGALAVSQLALIIIASHGLTPIEQGVYSTMRSLAGLVVVLDLGLSLVLVQTVAHLRGDGESDLPSQFAAILHFAVRWYGVAAVIGFAFLTFCGFSVLASHREMIGASATTPWMLTSLILALTILLLPLQAVLEGKGHVVSIALLRGAQALGGAVACGATVALGGGLWCIPALAAVSLTIGMIWIGCLHRQELLPAWHTKVLPALHWRRDIFPFQWRIGVSWISGWVIYQLYVPIIFLHEGPVAAGQFGLSMEACAGLTSLGAAWVGFKAPAWGKLVAQADYAAIDKDYRSSTRAAFLIVALAVFLFGAGFIILHALDRPIAQRFLPPLTLAPLLAAAVLNQSVFAMATYLRSHKREPYLAPTVVGAVLLGTWTLLAGPWVGVAGLAYAHLVVTLLVGWIWGRMIFLRCRTTWHINHVLSDSDKRPALS